MLDLVVMLIAQRVLWQFEHHLFNFCAWKSIYWNCKMWAKNAKRKKRNVFELSERESVDALNRQIECTIKLFSHLLFNQHKNGYRKFVFPLSCGAVCGENRLVGYTLTVSRFVYSQWNSFLMGVLCWRFAAVFSWML